MKQTGTPVYVGNRVVGQVVGNRFEKRIRTKHILRQPLALSFDVYSLRQAEAAGATVVWVQNRDDGRTYTAPLQTIWEQGFTLDRGWGEQQALTLDRWTDETETTQTQLPLPF